VFFGWPVFLGSFKICAFSIETVCIVGRKLDCVVLGDMGEVRREGGGD